jgi:CubicO group peptidase (beta-lactamase class C family)
VRYLPILLLALLHGCAVQPAQWAGDEQSTARLERMLEAEARRGFTGQVLVARGEHVLLLEAAGTREPGGREPVTIDDVMPLASVTKPFTASAVLALAADGRLSLEDPIGRHLPQLSPPWSEVPVAHFLTHTAGLPAEIVNRAWPGHPMFEPVGREDFLASLAHFPPDHPPGAGFNYSNVGYLVLGALIETVSGESWELFLQRRLLAPAQIEQVGLLLPAWGAGRPVHGRVAGEDRGSYFDQPRLEDGLGWRIRAAGDLQATPQGVLAWWLSIQRGDWLPPAARAEWTTPRGREPDGSEYGYGLNFRRSRAGRIIGHTGSDGVFTSDWSWLADHDLLIYVASADPRHPADEVRESLLRALFRR